MGSISCSEHSDTGGETAVTRTSLPLIYWPPRLTDHDWKRFDEWRMPFLAPKVNQPVELQSKRNLHVGIAIGGCGAAKCRCDSWREHVHVYMVRVAVDWPGYVWHWLRYNWWARRPSNPLMYSTCRLLYCCHMLETAREAGTAVLCTCLYTRGHTTTASTNSFVNLKKLCPLHVTAQEQDAVLIVDNAERPNERLSLGAYWLPSR